MTAALNLCAAYTQRPFRTPQRPVPGRRSRLSAPPEPHACFAASKAAFSSSFIRPCFAAVNAVFHLFCARAVPPTASPPQGAAPVQAAAEWPPARPPWKMPLSPQQRPTSPPPAEDTSPLPLCRLARRPMLCKSRPAPRPKPPHQYTSRPQASPARRSARIMPPLPSAPIQARSTKTHFGTPVCGPSRRRLSLFLLFFIPHGYNAEHAKTSSLHFSKAKARVRTETPAHSCPRPCRPWMQAAPTARRGCLAASPR